MQDELAGIDISLVRSECKTIYNRLSKQDAINMWFRGNRYVINKRLDSAVWLVQLLAELLHNSDLIRPSGFRQTAQLSVNLPFNTVVA